MSREKLHAIIAECAGTAALLAVIVGSGIMGERLSGGNAAIALLANSLATGAGLYVLISVLGPISGAHFNPVVTLMVWWRGGCRTQILIGYIVVQFAGAILGVMLAHAMFGLPLLDTGVKIRTGSAQWVSEAVATTGLLSLLILASREHVRAVPALVGSYIVAAYWFTGSTAFANPAVTLARSLSTTFAGIRPADVPGFILAQVVACVLVLAAYHVLRASPVGNSA
ncbi:MAG: MIP/aquaporin family protein [Rudaea sp.]